MTGAVTVSPTLRLVPYLIAHQLGQLQHKNLSVEALTLPSLSSLAQHASTST